MKKSLIILFAFSFLFSCANEKKPREKVLDNISHTEKEIIYQIDSLPRLCDNISADKKMVDIGGCRLYCEVEGEGVPLVLIHGGPGGTHHYFHPWFSQAKDYCKVIYYDQRGCGQSDYVADEGYSFKQAITDLEKLRERLNIDKWIVCGYSYGGGLTQYYTAKYPDKVLGMVLLSSSSMLHDDSLKGTRQYDFISEEEKAKIKEIKTLYNEDKLDLSQLLINIKLNGDWKRQHFLKPTREEMIRIALYEWVHDEDFNQLMSNSFKKYDFKGVFNNCPIPTLMCEAKWDLTWNKNKANIFKQNHPNAQLVTFENAGHSLYLDEPEKFFSTLKGFTESIKPASQEEILNWQNYVNGLLVPQEKMIENEARFISVLNNKDLDSAIKLYKEIKSKNEKAFTENGMNRLGYDYLSDKKVNIAIELFKLNVNEYPDSWNVYDSLGEAYLENGNKENAIENYKKSVELNPENENGIKVLTELQSKKI